MFGRGAFARVPTLACELARAEHVADVDALRVFVVAGASGRFVDGFVDAMAATAPNATTTTYRCPRGEPTVASAMAATRTAIEARCEIVIALGGGPRSTRRRRWRR